MCVIMVCGDKRPTPSLVDQAWAKNDHGGGVAWREPGKDNETIVRWEKGLTKEQMHEYAKNLPFPFILHFRIASVGGRFEDLCHPFEIGPKASTKLSGSTNRGVLFHNGTWGQWRSVAMDLAINRGIKVPPGPWNDTRTMAWVTSHLGDGILEFINERTVLFGPKLFTIFGEGWEDVEGIPCSNKLFLNTFRSQGGNQSRNGTVVGNVAQQSHSRNTSGNQRPDITVISEDEKTGGSSHKISFRGSIEIVSRGEALEEQMEEGSEGSSEGSSGGVQGKEGSRSTFAAQNLVDPRTTVLGPRPAKTLTEEQAKVVSMWSHATSLNPKRYSGHTPISTRVVVEDDVESSDRHRRIDAARRGIDFLGRL